MTNDEQRQADIDMLKRHSEQLSEHFDCVQIFACRHIPAELNGTRIANYGSGNWYARYGQVKHWVIEHEEQTRESLRRDNAE